ncbi:MAG: hypothetical protein C4523_12020 [Myxococcales bacterium]|nr:MAG: hypothetical protein C4523_12020 [Myxococcales bacterium]
MRLVYGLFILAVAAFPLSAAAAEDVTLAYDDGEGDGWFGALGESSLEGVMFFMERPAALKRIRLFFWNPGPAEIHVWADGGGNDPDRSKDLIEPIVRDILGGELRTWIEFDLTAAGVEPPPLRYVHVGTIRQADGAALSVDDSTGGLGLSYIYPDDDPTVKYGAGDVEYMVRIDVEYRDAATHLVFDDITEASGLPAGAGRMAWGDCDNDGDDDLLIGAGKLYRNNGDGAFTDISDAAGVTGIPGSGVWADYDNDGRLDYYAFSHGDTPETRDRLVHNGGNCTFSQVTDDLHAPWDIYPTEAAAWADYDNDGWVDLYVANYEMGDELGAGTPDFLWKNLGEGKFRDVTAEAGMAQRIPLCGRGLAWGDYNNDGWPDLYVANYRLDPNLLYENNGDGAFTDVALAKGVRGDWALGAAAYGHSIGAEWGDANNDGYPDLVVGNLAHPRFIDFSDKTMLYINSGPPDYAFVDVREPAGIAYSETHSDVLWLDYDNDGWQDLFITGIYTEYVSFLYHNEQNLTFTDVSYPTGAWVFNGWGVAASDFDRDGDLDFLTNRFFRNKTISPSRQESPHWLQVQLVGHRTNRFGIGSRVTVTAGGATQLREVEGGKGTGVQNSLIAHFGLGEAAIVDEVRVRWVDGSETVRTDLAADQRIIMEEEGEPECLNQLGACLSETRLRVCRHWQWTEEDCPEGTTCEERFCNEPVVEDGDEEGDIEAPPDGDEDGQESEESLDGDAPADGDETDGDVPGDFDLPLPDGDAVHADGDDEAEIDDELGADGDAAVAEGDDGGGCRNAGGASGPVFLLGLLSIVFGMRGARREA